MSHRNAVEFVLRKDYRTDWEAEVKEEYTYFTQREFEDTLAALGLRLLASTPLFNPWIVRHRFEGKFTLRSLGGQVLDWPATNTLVVGEKVAAGEGVRFVPTESAEPAGFLEMTHYRDRTTSQVRDLVRRPHRTLDVVPFFETQGDLFVIARASYPRPILALEDSASPPLDGSRSAHYVVEPLNVLESDRSLGESVERMLFAEAAIPAASIRSFLAGTTYYPSPGGTQEEVRAVLVELVPPLGGESLGAATRGKIRTLRADQVLRAAQVGGLPDARIELNAYGLFRARGKSPGPWIGEVLDLVEAPRPARIEGWSDLVTRPSRRRFERLEGRNDSAFLAIGSRTFEERDAAGRIIDRSTLEYVVPRTRSTVSIACAVLRRHGNEILLGIDDDDLPAAQCFTGNSELLVAPAWRLPHHTRGWLAAHDFLRKALDSEYGIRAGRIRELGGRYVPSPGLSPEVVYPVAVEVTGEVAGTRALRWVRLSELEARSDSLADGHLRVIVHRAAHATTAS